MEPADTPENFHHDDPYGPTLTITVGTDTAARTFTISQYLLQHYSHYFRHITSPYHPLPLTPSTTIRLPGSSPETFTLILTYLETRTFYPLAPSSNTHQSPLLSFDTLTTLHALSSSLGIPLTQNASLDLFFEKIAAGTLPDRWGVEFLWETTWKGCKLRKMLVEVVREMWRPERVGDEVWGRLVGGRSEGPEELVGMMEALRGPGGKGVRVSGRTRRRHLACEWHVHHNNEPCEGAEEFILSRGYRAEAEMEGYERGTRGPYRGIKRATDSPSHYFG